MSAGRMGQAWGRLRSLPDRTPLRVKMITAVLVLAAAALVVISVIGISVLNRDLLGQADTQLNTLYQRAETGGGHFNSNAIGPEAWVFEAVPPNSPPQIAQSNLVQASEGPSLSSATIAWLNAHPGQPVTVPGQSGGKWRIVAYPNFDFYNPATGGTVIATLVVGLDVSSQYATIGQLVLIDFVVSAILLLLLLVIGIAVVRASLRPLTDIEKTAGAIAAGDLTRRVPDLDPRTEVGSLAQSLNTMLSQIEMAFDARAESEFAARRSEEQMRQFLADASHELRTPLTAIRGFAEYYRQRGGATENPSLPPGSDAGGEAEGADAVVARRRGPNAEPADRAGSGPLPRVDLDRIMHRVEQESSRMGGLVEDMLLLARLDQERPLELGTVDMLMLAGDAVHDARMVAPDRSINLTVGSGAALLVLGDEARLRQVIGNLINNAISHTPEGSPIEVRVRLGSLDEWRSAAAAARRAATNRGRQGAFAAASPNFQPLPAVVFEIADQGPGLTQAQAEHVFERFYRADQARTRQAGGAGLGLAIVAALVAAHGGNVWVESPPGGGAIFRIAVPLAPEARNSGPDLDDGMDPDMDSDRTLSSPPGVAPGLGYPASPASPGFGYPAPPSAFPQQDDPGPASPAQAAAPPLPKRRPGYSGHART